MQPHSLHPHRYIQTPHIPSSSHNNLPLTSRLSAYQQIYNWSAHAPSTKCIGCGDCDKCTHIQRMQLLERKCEKYDHNYLAERRRKTQTHTFPVQKDSAISDQERRYNTADTHFDRYQRMVPNKDPYMEASSSGTESGQGHMHGVENTHKMYQDLSDKIEFVREISEDNISEIIRKVLREEGVGRVAQTQHQQLKELVQDILNQEARNHQRILEEESRRQENTQNILNHIQEYHINREEEGRRRRHEEESLLELSAEYSERNYSRKLHPGDFPNNVLTSIPVPTHDQWVEVNLVSDKPPVYSSSTQSHNPTKRTLQETEEWGGWPLKQHKNSSSFHQKIQKLFGEVRRHQDNLDKLGAPQEKESQGLASVESLVRIKQQGLRKTESCLDELDKLIKRMEAGSNSS